MATKTYCDICKAECEPDHEKRYFSVRRGGITLDVITTVAEVKDGEGTRDVPDICMSCVTDILKKGIIITEYEDNDEF